jgi:hypothetical protein
VSEQPTLVHIPLFRSWHKNQMPHLSEPLFVSMEQLILGRLGDKKTTFQQLSEPKDMSILK